MRKYIRIAVWAGFVVCAAGACAHAAAGTEVRELKRGASCARIPAVVLRQVPVPRSYHEGLSFDGRYLWLANGEGGPTWRIDPSTGAVVEEIASIGCFTEAVVGIGGGEYVVSEWDDRKLYRARRDGDGFTVLAERSFAPAHPAGVVWTGSRLYAITWTRGLGTKYHLVEMDRDMQVLRSLRIRDIHEPCQLAWDGKHLWISSWYSQAVYEIDPERMEIVGSLCSPAKLTTGIVWVDRSLWLTGTYSDLYELMVGERVHEEEGAQ